MGTFCMHRVNILRFATALTLSAAVCGLHAQPAATGWQISAEAGAVHQWQSGIDEGGDLSVDAWSFRLGANRAWTSALRAGLSAGVGQRNYQFTGAAGFGGSRPWSDVRDARISASLNWQANERWNVFAIPTVRWSAETGAALDDGRTGGLLAAATYRVNDRLSIGPGFGVFSELEDETGWFPILAVDWQITDRMSLRTGRGFASTRGPGLALVWDASERWSFSVGGRYEKERFRLDDGGIAPDGIGQETSVPLYLGITRSFGRTASFSVIAGAKMGGRLRLEDDNGDLLEESDYDTAPFAGATFDLRF